MKIKHFFDEDTSTFTYIVSDCSTLECAIIDPVLNFDLSSGVVSNTSANALIKFIKENNLKLVWILETHAHADHLSSAAYLQEKLGGKIAIGEHIKTVLEHWVPIFNTENDTDLNGSQFDVLLKDNDVFKIGTLDVKVIHTPGHTPACISFLIGENLFVGDTIFMPSVGTARTDFPGGNARQQYNSIQKILKFPDQFRLFMCHDYPSEDQLPQHISTVAEQKAHNIMIHDGINEESYILARQAKDLLSTTPRLILPSIQVNLRAGRLGDNKSNEKKFIKIPITLHLD